MNLNPTVPGPSAGEIALLAKAFTLCPDSTVRISQPRGGSRAGHSKPFQIELSFEVPKEHAEWAEIDAMVAGKTRSARERELDEVSRELHRLTLRRDALLGVLGEPVT